MFDLFYPKQCLVCRSKQLNNNVLCHFCQTDFHLLDPTYRCQHCFEQAEGICLNCSYEFDLQHIRVAYCWEEGRELLDVARKGWYKRLLSDLLLVQLDRLGWELPDRVITVPGRGEVGYIKAFAKKLKVPFDAPLYKKPGSLPRSYLPLSERINMPVGLIAAKKRACWKRHFLLVDDAIGTYQTIQAAGRLLYQYGACRVDVLALTRVYVD